MRHTVQLSGYEYYKLIKSLKVKGDNYLLEKILVENCSVFPISVEDVLIIESIFVRLLYTAQNPFNNDKEIGISKHNELNIKEILEISEVDYSYFDINKDTKHSDIESKVLSKIKEAPLCVCDSYSFLRNKSIKQQCIIYEYEDSSLVSEGHYFGEYNDDGNLIHKANTTINNCKVLAFSSLNYMDYVKKEKKKLIQDEISFLRDYFFFGSIYQQKFLRYFHFFTKENLVKGDILFKEKKPIEYIYFLYEGQIEFTSERSIIDNHLLIQVLDDKIKGFSKKNIKLIEKNNSDQEEEFLSNREINLLEEEINPSYDEDKHQHKGIFDLQEKIESTIYRVIKNQPKNMKKELMLNLTQKLFVIQQKECIGFECFNYGFDFLYSAKVISEKAILYKLSTNNLVNILQDKNDDCYISFNIKAGMKLRALTDRIKKLNSGLLSIIDKNYSILKTKTNSLNSSSRVEKLSPFKNKSQIILPNTITLLKDKKKIKSLGHIPIIKVKINNEHNDNNNYKVESYTDSKKKNFKFRMKSPEDILLRKLKKYNNFSMQFYRGQINSELEICSENINMNSNLSSSTINSSNFKSTSDKFTSTKEIGNYLLSPKYKNTSIPSTTRKNDEKNLFFEHSSLRKINRNKERKFSFNCYTQRQNNSISRRNVSKEKTILYPLVGENPKLKKAKLFGMPFEMKRKKHVQYLHNIKEKLNKIKYYET